MGVGTERHIVDVEGGGVTIAVAPLFCWPMKGTHWGQT